MSVSNPTAHPQTIPPHRQIPDSPQSPNFAAQSAQFRGKLVRAQYEALPEAEQEAYLQRAIVEGDAVRAEYDKLRKEGPSVAPEARQKYVFPYDAHALYV